MYHQVAKKSDPKKSLLRGIEPRSRAWQARILTVKLQENSNWANQLICWKCCIISLARCLIYKAWFYWLFITLVVAHHLGIELFLFLFSVFCLHLVRRVIDIIKLVGYWVVWWFIVTLVFGLYKGQRFSFVFLYILYFYILFFS